jgi:hypothetical protein
MNSSASVGKHNRNSSLPAYLPSNPAPSDTSYSLWGMPRLFLVDKPSNSGDSPPVGQHRPPPHSHRHTNSMNHFNWKTEHSKKEQREFKRFENNVLTGLGLELESRPGFQVIKNLDEEHEVDFTPTSENTFLMSPSKLTSNEEDELDIGNQTSFDSLSVMSEDSSPYSPRMADVMYDVNGEEICQHFLKGKCRFRERCRNSHNVPNCIYCFEELPVNRVAASAHLHHCWRLSQHKV